MAGDYLGEKGLHFEFSEPEISPFKKGEKYEIVGPGSVDVDCRNRQLTFFDSSCHYNIGPNKEHLDRVGKPDPNYIIEVR